MTTPDPLLLCICITALIIYGALAVYLGFIAKEKLDQFQKWLETLRDRNKE